MTLPNFNNNYNISKFIGKFIGFNLIELMIAIAVLAVIVAASVIKYKDYVKRSEINHAINYANNVKEKIMLYYLDNEKIPNAAIINNDFSSANLDENTKKYVSNILYVAGGDISGLPDNVENQIGNAQGVKWFLRVTINPDIVPNAEVGYVFSVINNVETLMPFTVGIDQKFQPKGYLSACFGNQVLNNGVCSCPTGTSLIGGVCSRGITCSAGQYLNTAIYSCSACASGTYSSGGTVTSCSSNTVVANCATYSTTANQCSTCNPGYLLSNGACVLNVSCQAGKYFNTATNNCVACTAGKYSLGGTVTSCTQNTTVANCSTYSTTENKCAACEASYYLNTATNSCIVCAPGTYSSGGAVNSCMPNTRVDYCTNYDNKNDQCLTFACPPGQFVMTNPSVCVPCSPNYYSSGGNTNVCLQVTPVANCIAYSSAENKCISCANGTVLVNGSCVACPSSSSVGGLGESTGIGNCNCPANYTWRADTCMSCASITGNAYTTYCSGPASSAGTGCFYCPPTGNTCQISIGGLGNAYIDKTYCAAICSANCSSCTSATNCIACGNGTVLVNGSCVVACPSNSIRGGSGQSTNVSGCNCQTTSYYWDSGSNSCRACPGGSATDGTGPQAVEYYCTCFCTSNSQCMSMYGPRGYQQLSSTSTTSCRSACSRPMTLVNNSAPTASTAASSGSSQCKCTNINSMWNSTDNACR